jgi:hypothetical protein
MLHPTRLLRLVVTALLAVGAAPLALAAEPVYPPGSRIGIVPPAGMTLARGVSGFRDPETGAGILLVELPPDAFPNLRATLTDQALKAQGFQLLSRETIPLGAGDGTLVTGEQREGGGRKLVKSMLLGADQANTVLVMGQMPPQASVKTIAEVQKALRTTVLRPVLSLDERIASLPFTIVDRAGLRPIRTMSGNALLLTDGPNDTIKDADQPALIVAQSFNPSPPAAQRETFARQSLASNSFVKDTVLERSQSFRQGGTDWHELVATGKDAVSGTPIVVMQTIRFEPDSFIRSIGIARPAAREEAFARFRRVVDSTVAK